MSSSRALVIGINGYGRWPLESAVADARSFATMLLRVGLVASENLTLLTSPGDAEKPPSYQTIREEIRHLYREGEEIQRFFFYFAGHGILAFRDPAATEAVTALLPEDVEDLGEDGNLLINLDEVRSYLRLAGPREQFYFIDACRDMPYDQSPPRLGSLGFGSQPPGPARSQSVLYAVSELGQARASTNEGGDLTRHLLGALEGQGCSLDYDAERLEYVVTMESVRNYVGRRLKQEEESRSDFSKGVAKPALEQNDPKPDPLLVVRDPLDRRLVLHISPDYAAPATSVSLGHGDGPTVCTWPPELNHAAVSLRPRIYELKASSQVGAVDPSRRVLDAREEDEATVWVTSGSSSDPDAPVVEVAEPSGPSPGDGEAAVINAEVPSSFFAVDVEGLEPPYSRLSNLGRLTGSVPPGAYRLQYRFGPSVLSRAEFFAPTCSEVRVRPPDSLRAGDLDRHPRLEVQALAEGLAGESDGSGVVVLVALEGDSLRAIEELERMRLGVQVSSSGGIARTEVERRPEGRVSSWGAFAVVELGSVESPFELLLEAPHLGEVGLVAASIPGFATLIVALWSPAGELDISQHFVPPGMELGEMSRWQGYQQLYKSHELTHTEVLRRLYEGPVDPLLACMLAYSQSATQTFGEERSRERPPLSLLVDSLVPGTVLPDSAIALAKLDVLPREEVLESLLDLEAAPVLDRSLAELAAFAVATGHTDHPLVRRRRRVSSRQTWNLVQQPTGTGFIGARDRTKVLH